MWCDDDLDAHRDDVAAATAQWGDRLLLVCPDPQAGLSPAELARIESHLAGVPSV